MSPQDRSVLLGSEFRRNELSDGLSDGSETGEREFVWMKAE